jgi:hypothetical protein
MSTRRPELPPSRTPKIIAVVVAVVITAALFSAVASLGVYDSGSLPVKTHTTVVAQSEAPVNR